MSRRRTQKRGPVRVPSASGPVLLFPKLKKVLPDNSQFTALAVSQETYDLGGPDEVVIRARVPTSSVTGDNHAAYMGFILPENRASAFVGAGQVKNFDFFAAHIRWDSSDIRFYPATGGSRKTLTNVDLPGGTLYEMRIANDQAATPGLISYWTSQDDGATWDNTGFPQNGVPYAITGTHHLIFGAASKMHEFTDINGQAVGGSYDPMYSEGFEQTVEAGAGGATPVVYTNPAPVDVQVETDPSTGRHKATVTAPAPDVAGDVDHYLLKIDDWESDRIAPDIVQVIKDNVPPGNIPYEWIAVDKAGNRTSLPTVNAGTTTTPPPSANVINTMRMWIDQAGLDLTKVGRGCLAAFAMNMMPAAGYTQTVDCTDFTDALNRVTVLTSPGTAFRIPDGVYTDTRTSLTPGVGAGGTGRTPETLVHIIPTTDHGVTIRNMPDEIHVDNVCWDRLRFQSCSNPFVLYAQGNRINNCIATNTGGNFFKAASDEVNDKYGDYNCVSNCQINDWNYSVVQISKVQPKRFTATTRVPRGNVFVANWVGNQVNPPANNQPFAGSVGWDPSPPVDPNSYTVIAYNSIGKSANQDDEFISMKIDGMATFNNLFRDVVGAHISHRITDNSPMFGNVVLSTGNGPKLLRIIGENNLAEFNLVMRDKSSNVANVFTNAEALIMGRGIVDQSIPVTQMPNEGIQLKYRSSTNCTVRTNFLEAPAEFLDLNASGAFSGVWDVLRAAPALYSWATSPPHKPPGYVPPYASGNVVTSNVLFESPNPLGFIEQDDQTEAQWRADNSDYGPENQSRWVRAGVVGTRVEHVTHDGAAVQVDLTPKVIPWDPDPRSYFGDTLTSQMGELMESVIEFEVI